MTERAGSIYINVDLHCHTTESDGEYSPEEIINKAHANDVDLLSITDHDTIDGYLKIKNSSSDLKLLPGVEISVQWGENNFAHILGYNFELESDLTRGLVQIQIDRMNIARAIDDQLFKNGFPRVLDKILEKKSGKTNMIFRTDFAIEYHSLGLEESVSAAKKTFFSPGCPGFINSKFISLIDAVKLITSSKGIAVIAHPGAYNFGKNINFIETFLNAGGTGIEVYNGDHSQEDIKYFTDFCIKNNIPASKGSDYHSPRSKGTDLGKVPQLDSNLILFWENYL